MIFCFSVLACLLDLASGAEAIPSQCSGQGSQTLGGNSWLQQRQQVVKGEYGSMRMDDWTTSASDHAQRLAATSQVSAVRASGEYVPGTPGAPWTFEEILIVKAKLWRLFSVHQAYQACTETGITGCEWSNAARLAPKLLRLGFHDCLKYVDGTGGCDGCLQWDGVGDRYGDTAGTYSIAANDTLSHNNGLGVAVQLLDALYTNPDFPSLTRPLQSSLRSSGKSRADLWAFAAIVAVEYTIMINNRVCVDPGYETGLGWGLDTNGANQRHCNHMSGSPDCQVDLSRPINFRTGRVDCAETYNTTKMENQPNAEANGEATIEFFKRDFNFTGRETVAIMGSHTLGRLHNGHSLFKYVWVHAGGMMFNNQYYRNIVGKRDYRFVSTSSACLEVGDAWGQKPNVRWVTHVRGDKVTGGPVHWIQEKLTCPAACVDPTSSDTCCSNGVPAGALCRPDGGRVNGSDAASADNDVNSGCESYRFISGHDEMALPSEIGLYYDFKVDENMIPYGCPGFENFNLDMWKSHGYRYTWSTINGIKTEPGCPKNTLESPVGSTPLHEIFEEYADSPGNWIRDFVPALEKMLMNGYTPDDLDNGQDQWTDVTCSGTLFWICFKTDQLQKAFYIVSDLDQRVLQHSAQGVVQLSSRLPGLDASQLWQWTAEGDVLVNSHTKLPLVIGSLWQWTFRPQSSWYNPPQGHNVLASGTQCIDRGWAKQDIHHVGTWSCWGGPVQHWSMEEIAP